jgi:hypothetical protein
MKHGLTMPCGHMIVLMKVGGLYCNIDHTSSCENCCKLASNKLSSCENCCYKL